MNRRGIYIVVMVVWIVAMSCGISLTGFDATQTPIVVTATSNAPVSVATTAVGPSETPQQVSQTPTFTIEPSFTATFTPTTCTGQVTATQDANVRSGPGTVYEVVGALLKDHSAVVAGKNSSGTWWYIEFSAVSGGHAWIAASVTSSECIPSGLAVIAAPPTPLPASGTCKDDYVWRLIKGSDKVCVSPASKAQADADNAAASSRTSVGVYGADACKSGFVWRDAFSSDHVCVTTATRSQAAADNAAASSRWTSGAYGAHTCISGYVWREARSGDDVCVTPDVHNQTLADNSADSSRKASADTCISGFVWREAFSGDHVCVTSAVRSQVQADNADAPNHTW